MGNWDETKERQFLMCIIHVQSVSAPDWNAVAEMLNGTTGEKFSGNALRQKFDKMKKIAKEEFGELPTPADGEGGATPTPKKRGSKKDEGSVKKSTPAKRKTSSKKSGAAVSEEVVKEEEDGEDENMETPTKKVKTEVAEREGEGDEDGLLT